MSAMSNKTHCSDHTSSLLSPKLRIKAQKRRRIRLGGGDTELERTTKELLTALKKPGLASSAQNSLKPLPAISSMKSKAADDRLIDFDESSQTAETAKVREQKMSLDNLAAPIERFPTFTKPDRAERFSQETDAAGVDSNKTVKTPQSELLKSNLKMIDDESGFSDISDELGFERRTRRRASRRGVDTRGNAFDNSAITGDVMNVVVKSGSSLSTVSNERTPRRRLARRGQNSPAVVTPIENLTLTDSGTPKATKKLFECDVGSGKKKRDVARSRRDVGNSDLLSPLSINHPVLAKPSKSRPLTDSSDQMKGNFSNGHDADFLSRRPRRRTKPHDQNSDAKCVGTTTADCSVSDAVSVFSDDFTETYDPTFLQAEPTTTSTNRRSSLRKEEAQFDKIRQQSMNFDPSSEGDDNLNIFTSPKRHKKRNRRRGPNELENRASLDSDGVKIIGKSEMPTERPHSDIFGSRNEDSFFGANDQLSTTGMKAGKRRVHNKYLPPLSEAFNNLK